MTWPVVKTIRAARVVAATTAAAALLFAAATTASAAPGNITQTHGSLTIVKLPEATPPGSAAPGTDQSIAPTGVIAGVEFTVAKLKGFDLTTTAGWDAVKDLTPEAAKALSTDAAATRTDTTVAGKSLVFSNLPLGVYLVTESKTPQGVVPSAPFLVTVPMPHPDDAATWLYDVVVYPKNAEVGLVKTVEDHDAVQPGDTITYRLKQDVPAGATKVTITDVLDPRLDYVVTSAITSAGGKAEFDPDTHTLTAEWNFTGEPVPSQVSVEFQAKVKGLGTNGIISNDAHALINTPHGDVEVGSAKVETRWGTLDIVKTNTSHAPIEGAEFSVYLNRDAAEAAGDDHVARATSDPNGKISFTLRYSDWAGGAVHSNEQIYYVVETKPAPGYQPNNAVHQVWVSDMDTDPELEVENTQYPGFTLPAIGGNRAVLPILAALVTAGGLMWMVRSRRQPAEASVIAE